MPGAPRGEAREDPRPPVRQSAPASDPRARPRRIVRNKLRSLGDFAHLIVYRQGDHLFIAHAAPADSPDDVDPVLRITHAGRWRLGLSPRRPSGRWQLASIAGAPLLLETRGSFSPPGSKSAGVATPGGYSVKLRQGRF